jgi:hypothetical protein
VVRHGHAKRHFNCRPTTTKGGFEQYRERRQDAFFDTVGHGPTSAIEWAAFVEGPGDIKTSRRSGDYVNDTTGRNAASRQWRCNNEQRTMMAIKKMR